ncbi:MAG TPA: RNA 2',3'-cyclic phosphodiesterase [Caulobacterales bacterium]|nr:RNA 2',3'-cyclic phosphodiesterase [Caulobacterales bacterium]
MSLRLFAAIALPDDVAERLLALQKGVPGAKWRPREALHLTLRFFGEVQEPLAEELDAFLAEIAARTAPFTLQLKAAGSFGGRDPHALWIGAEESPALTKLAAGCERAARKLGLKPDPHKFTPHVTLAYLTGAPLDRVQSFESRLGLFQARPFAVERFILYSSWTKKTGPNLYREEAEYALTASAAGRA